MYPGFGDYVGYVFSVASTTSLLRNLNIKPSPFIDMQSSDITWSYLTQFVDARTFIGYLDADLLQIFPQLGDPTHIILCASDGEGGVAIDFGYFQDSAGIFHKIYPGQINEIDSQQIAPRTLMISDHYETPLPFTQNRFNMDFVKILSDIQFGGMPFVDAGRSLIIGYHGVDTMEYAFTKISKIDGVQKLGGAFISIIQEQKVLENFETVISQSSNFASVFLDKQQGLVVEHLMNNPSAFNLGFKRIIGEIARKAYGLEYSADTSNEVREYIDMIEEANGGICLAIASAFGMHGTPSGNIEIGLNQYGQDLNQWWINFETSNNPNNGWYGETLLIKLNHLQKIKQFYHQINPEFTPDWIENDDTGHLLYLWNKIVI